MPTQWRTIAPIVGRTTTQCIERYQRLLDEAEEQDPSAAGPSGTSSLSLTGVSGPEAAPSAEDVRRLRPGEIDPDPESKPARPDPIDMDEDEKEMLSEARARLANTQGKKAKRKERERALEEARRLAMLQKRRELKAAGIVMRAPKPKKGQVDYNADIPFEKQPARGFYDTSEEASKAYQAPIGKTLAEVDRKRKTRLQEQEEEAAKKRQRDQQEKKSGGQAAFSAEKAEQLRKLKEAEQISKRRKLDLPAAQVGESELEEIVKLGQAGESARELVAAGGEATEGLLGSYDALDKAKTARTPRTAPEDDAVMREARNLRNMTAAQTPLLGDDNAPMEDGLERSSGGDAGRRRSSVTQTPNPLRAVEGTPRDPRYGAGATPMRTPFRDHIGLNDADAGSSVGGTPFDDRRARLLAKSELASSLRSLPMPKNDFELVLDEDEDEEGEVEGEGGARVDDEEDASDDSEEYITISEDAADRDARMAQRREEERVKALARRSRVVQMELPRPANVSSDVLLAANSKEATPSQRLIYAEMVQLIKHDSIAHPIAGGTSAGSAKSDLPVLADSALDGAREEIRAELARDVGFPGASEDVLKRVLGLRLYDDDDEEGKGAGLSEEGMALETWLKERCALSNRAWSAQSSSYVARSSLTPQEYKQGLSDLLSQAKKSMTTLATTASREEKRLQKLLGGYVSRSKTLSESLTDAYTTLSQSHIEHEAFERLARGESGAIDERLERLKEEVRKLERREDVQQMRFAELDKRRRELKEAVQRAREERDYLDAERLNERVLGEGGGEGGDGDDDDGNDDDEVGPPAP